MSIFECISTVISIIALAVSLKVYFKNRLFNNSAIELTFSSQLNIARDEILKIEQELATLKGKGQYDPVKIAVLNRYNVAIYSFLALYNNGCDKYYRNAINNNAFEKLYLPEIQAIYANPTYSSMLRKYNFAFLNKFHKDNCNKK